MSVRLRPLCKFVIWHFLYLFFWQLRRFDELEGERVSITRPLQQSCFVNILPNELQPEEEFPKEEPAKAASDELEEVVLEETALEDVKEEVKEDVKPEEEQEDDAEFKLFEDRWTAGILEVYSFFGHSCGIWYWWDWQKRNAMTNSDWSDIWPGPRINCPKSDLRQVLLILR